MKCVSMYLHNNVNGHDFAMHYLTYIAYEMCVRCIYITMLMATIFVSCQNFDMFKEKL
jgi:hypothetical protein